MVSLFTAAIHTKYLWAAPLSARAGLCSSNIFGSSQDLAPLPSLGP